MSIKIRSKIQTRIQSRVDLLVTVMLSALLAAAGFAVVRSEMGAADRMVVGMDAAQERRGVVDDAAWALRKADAEGGVAVDGGDLTAYGVVVAGEDAPVAFTVLHEERVIELTANGRTVYLTLKNAIGKVSGDDE